MDPTEWTSGTFNVTQAQNYANLGVPDLKPGSSSTTSGSKPSDFGPIVQLKPSHNCPSGG
ncbi:hypothetical protein V8B97DRAFT_1987091 [Scleroderma yunnanense]